MHVLQHTRTQMELLMAANNTTTTKTPTARKTTRPTSPVPPSDDVKVAAPAVDVELFEVEAVATVTEPVTVKAKGGRKPNPLTQLTANYVKAKQALARVDAKIAAQADLTQEQSDANLAYLGAKEALDAAYAALTA